VTTQAEYVAQLEAVRQELIRRAIEEETQQQDELAIFAILFAEAT